MGSVIMGIFDAEKVAELLHIPQDEIVVALISIGYPDAHPDAPVRKPVSVLLDYVE